MKAKIQIIAITVFAVLTLPFSGQSQLILAGWDNIPSGGGASDIETTPQSANITAAGITATVFGGDGDRDTWGSTDGSFGTITGATSVVDGALTLRNQVFSERTLTFSLTNNGAQDVELSLFVFDYLAARNGSNARPQVDQLTFTYVNGDLAEADGTQIGQINGVDTPNQGAPVTGDYVDASFDIASVLTTDNILSTGESAVFTLFADDVAANTGNTAAGVPLGIDNMAFTAIPEPSTAVLILSALGVLFWMRRR